MVDERDVESALVELVGRLGGLCLKLDSSTMKGIHDRLVLLPRGRVWFVELKRPDGGRRSPLQRIRAKQIERLGFPQACVGSVEELAELAKKW